MCSSDLEIRRLSVAVVLNGHYEKHGDHQTFVARSPDEVQAMSAIVKRAVGFNAERGDEVELRAVQFARLDTSDDAQVVDPLAKYRRFLPFVLAGLLALLLLTAVILVWRRSKAKQAEILALKEAQTLTVEQLAAAANTGRPGQLGSDEMRTLLLEDHVGSEEIRARALELAAKDPATAAVVLRGWLGVGAPALSATPSPAE